MAIINDTGIASTQLTTYKTLLENSFKAALGADLDVDAQTPQGQLIGIIALALSNMDDAVVSLFQQLDIYNASGNQLDSYGALFEIARTLASSSTVIAEVTGVPAATIPVGSRAKTTNGDIFESTGVINLDGSGDGSGEFQSIETGQIQIDANTLTQIIDVIAGWETISNSTAGTVGELKQTDIEYRSDYFSELNKNAVATIDAIQSNVAAVDKVDSVVVHDNDTSSNVTIQNVTLLPHSIAVIVEGGVAQEIGQAISDSKTVGANTAGNNLGLQIAVVVDTNGGLIAKTVYYYPVVFVTVDIKMSISQYAAEPDTVDQIKTAIIAYFEGTYSADIPAINISDSSYLSRLYTPINSIGGFDVVSLTQEIQGSGTPQSVITPDLNKRLIVSNSSISVSIV